MNIAVFASHSGSNLQSVIDACQNGVLNAQVCVVISNNKDSLALKRAENANIPYFYLSIKEIPDEQELNNIILQTLVNNNTDIIVLAGYLRKLGIETLQRYHNKVFNIHPALLPKYGGKGMYGIAVHQAVIQAGEKFSGVTIHIVNEEYDSGKIVVQAQVPVLDGDTPELLAERILQREHTFLVETLIEIIKTI